MDRLAHGCGVSAAASSSGTRCVRQVKHTEWLDRVAVTWRPRRSEGTVGFKRSNRAIGV
jgi:hypothetical protein